MDIGVVIFRVVSKNWRKSWRWSEAVEPRPSGLGRPWVENWKSLARDSKNLEMRRPLRLQITTSLTGRVTRLGDFSPVGLLLEAYQDFFKRFCSLKKWQHFGKLFAQANLLHFHLNMQFQKMGCCRYSKVSWVVWCKCLGNSNWALLYIFWHFCRL